ncbi:MAG TPA: pilus (MSHA type) biogenesis protein MshL [Zoogloea sp.]|uniref:pilus (MSHA type) biogenesis protein MshL n=1 Tax=Zoogloea sp. TaxID=49181 RepID=UPI002D12771E|nr:pilus (MSHA type) biogenesis protein MshL [Zoogloea sp.]HMV17889.1 pilus (MSHA type) biogenesis protein MshL [Rhodocyclaceae bacterium]HMW53697.1 pilus (MSHA type) biogenesis protein MshL [Rhodocyclaceae bacterium]HMY51162.1 pilus (MSHA type) biogenesis protein MshL [Rhodocyclaceae bacterium]HMZ76786.1 pilus (MSHA type) biogenesis protein MshL [Rhodocyclaceae bacterium]HNA68592.1 pilus (MSHA type) biogenesis protein MshL [Rhodocyclaceae bacterium]
MVHNVRLQDLLFALARDARLNVDIHPGLNGTVTLNAIDQTLPQILTRLARQADLRFELDGTHLAVMPDSPYLRTYRVDYVNLSRSVTGTVSTNTQIATSGSGSAVSGSTTLQTAALPNGGNVSATRIENASRNQFWESIERNIRDLLRETDKLLPEGSSDTVIENLETTSTSGTGVQPSATAARSRTRTTSASPQAGIAASPNPALLQNSATTVVHKATFREAASVIVNRETGVLTVRATGRQHEKVQEFLDQVVAAARRQVLIEATILEVGLSDTYRQGIDWNRVLSSGTRFGITGPTLGSSAGNAVNPFSVAYKSADGIDSTIRLLEGFGTVKVLSSPKLSVLNNQTAVIKVVEEYVYFNVKADTTQTTNAGALTTVTTTPQAVSVGLVMTVTPQVSEADEIILNVRPTISSIADFRRDPNPNIPATIPNLVPQIRTREIESVLRIENGETAVLGGLMEDRVDFKTGRVPGVGAVPLLGEVFTTRDNLVQKTELVIFLRPVVVRDGNLLAASPLRNSLPRDDFFRRGPLPGTRNFPDTTP